MRAPRFRNADPSTDAKKTLFDVLKWRLTSPRASWPDFIDDNAVPGIAPRVDDATMRITMINHVTLLIQAAGLNILTDPVFSQRVSPFRFSGPKRHRAAGIAIDALPPIDLVLVSHAHYDHLERASLDTIEHAHAPRYLTPLRNADLLPVPAQRDGRVQECGWNETYVIAPQLEIVTLPAQHWSARGLHDRNRRLWGAFLLRLILRDGTRRQIYFAGDTGYNGHFSDVFARYGAVDAALLPIGAYEPRWFMKMQHMNPSDAVQAHLDLQARQSIGMHFGTFQLTDEAIDQPEKDLADALVQAGVDRHTFIAPKNGQTIVIE